MARSGPTHALVAGFDRAAAAYERGRPGFPPAAIDRLAAELGLGPGRRVVDLGAGTGKFTRALGRTGAAVLAVEPTAGMRRELAARLPGVPLVAGTAEALPVATASVDAVVSAQAFHWFDVPRAAAAIARALRPGGGLGLVWNLRDETVPWVAALTRILDRHDPGAPRGRTAAWRAPLAATGLFEPLAEAEYAFVQRTDPATIVDRALSVSFVAVTPPATQAAVAREVAELLATDPATRGRALVDLPYRTRVYWTRRRPVPDGATARTSHPGRQAQAAHFPGAGVARPS